MEGLGERQLLKRFAMQCQQILAKCLQFFAFTLQFTAAGRLGALEFSPELPVEFAALGREFTIDVIAFAGFARHEAEILQLAVIINHAIRMTTLPSKTGKHGDTGAAADAQA